MMGLLLPLLLLADVQRCAEVLGLLGVCPGCSCPRGTFQSINPLCVAPQGAICYSNVVRVMLGC
jgi:hypothetical protein